MSCYIIISEQQQMYDNTVHADAKNAGGARGRFSCRINMKNADPGANLKTLRGKSAHGCVQTRNRSPRSAHA